MKNIYILTASYPYGYQESFLDEEVPYLAKVFNNVYIIPFGGHQLSLRNLPSNGFVLKSLKGGRWKKVTIGLLFSYRVFPVFIKDLLKASKISKKEFSRWFRSLVMTSFYMHSELPQLLEKLESNDVIYSYWGAEYCNIFAFVKTRAKCVSRFHGFWDLWEDRDVEGYIPLRKYVIERLDYLITISHLGENFLRTKYNIDNIRTFHLGTKDFGCNEKSSDGVIRVLSCSSVYALKRVDLIGELLRECYDYNFEWTHIGDGEDFDILKEKCVAIECDHLKINLLGRLPHENVPLYYANNKVDIFINMSTSEGIPVSIMEAISHNIPVIATNVGGTSEVVNSNTGILISKNPSISEFNNAIKKIISNNCEPRLYWQKEFSSEINYSSFAQFLSDLN